MPIVRLYPESEVPPQPLSDAAPNVSAAGDLNLFGGNRARDLQLAGHNLGQASDTLAALHQRHAQQANDTRVQDFNNQFIMRVQQTLRTGPDAYSRLEGADAIRGADAVTQQLAGFKDELLQQAPNEYQRRKLGPILEAHLASAKDEIARHVGRQQQVYEHSVHRSAIEVAGREAITNPEDLAAAALRAADATRALYSGQAPEVVESETRRAQSRVVSGLITDRLNRGDPAAVSLYRQHENRLHPSDRSVLGAAVTMLSNTLGAAAWLHERSATLSTPAPTGDQTLDAVNAVDVSNPEPPPVVSSADTLLDQEGIAGTRERLAGIETRRRALTALNESEFAANPVRLRANQTAIDMDTARSRAAVKADTDTLYADLRRHLTTGGPNRGPAVTAPPATILSRLTDAQQDAVTAQINANIEGSPTRTDPLTWYAIRQGLTSDDANERQRWASKSLVQFMSKLSADDLASLETLQATVRTNGGGAEQSRLRNISRMANDALRSVGIDPTPRPDAPIDSDAAQAERFHRALEDELSAFERKGGKPTEAEAYDIVTGLKDTAIMAGWLKVNDRPPASTTVSGASDDTAFHRPGAQLAQADTSDHQGASGLAPATEPDTASDTYRRAQQVAESPGRRGIAPPTEPPSNDPDSIRSQEAWPGVQVVLPNGDRIEDPKSPTGYVMAPFPELRSVVNAARRARSEIQAATAVSSTATPFVVALMIRDMLKRNVGHGGDFDYQRQANKNQKDGYVQLRQFRNVSNINVGLFCQRLGLPRSTALTIAGVYAYLFSSNSRPDEPYYLDADTKKYIDIGYDLGERGKY